jgi:hypothetical protein
LAVALAALPGQQKSGNDGTFTLAKFTECGDPGAVAADRILTLKFGCDSERALRKLSRR